MEPEPKKGRLLAGRIVAGLLGLTLLSFIEPYLSYLMDEPTGVHAFHEVSNLVYGLMLAMPLVAIAFRPAVATGALRLVFGLGVAGLIGVLATRETDAELLGWAIFLPILPVIVAVSGGFRMWRGPWVARGRMTWLPLALLVGFGPYMLHQLGLQIDLAGVDEHAEFRHYSYMAVAILGVVAGGLVATPRIGGRYLVAAITGLSAVALGIGSMVTGTTSSFGLVGELSLIVGGLAFVVLARKEQTA